MRRKVIDHKAKAAEFREKAKQTRGIYRKICRRMAEIHELQAARQKPKAGTTPAETEE